MHFCRRGRALAGAGRTLALFAAVLMVSNVGCSSVYHMSVGSQSPRPQLDFSEIRERNSESIRAASGGVALEVRFAPGEEDLAETALEEAIASVEYATSALGIDPDEPLTLYLYPWPEDEASPSYTARGSGYHMVIFYSDPASLVSETNRRARHTLRPMLAHKVAIRYLMKQRYLDPNRDRWILEGLAEAMAESHAAAADPEVLRLVHRWNPPRAVLHASELEGWNDRELLAMVEAFRKGDQRLAAYYGHRETLRLTAARGLLLEWLAAARARGYEQPGRELFARLRAAGAPPDWTATKELAEEMTGQSVEELARLEEDELTALRRRSWEQRAASDLVDRVQALRVLTYVGLPDDAAPDELREAFLFADTLEPADRSTLKEAAGGALAHADDAELARWAIARLMSDSERAFNYLSVPRLWKVVGLHDRGAALAELLAILRDDRFSLTVQEEAHEALTTLTGQQVAWSATAPEPERQAAVDRWVRILA